MRRCVARRSGCCLNGNGAYAGSPATAQRELQFSDANEGSDWALDALLWANEHGVMNGDGKGHLNPKGTATRAQVAQMLKNYLSGALN